MKNLIWISTMALGCMALLPACNGASIEGAWVEPVPGMENMQQGFVLEPDGTASSINMATLQYESWKKEGDVLILAGKSIGNHQTIAFSDTLVIKDLFCEVTKRVYFIGNERMLIAHDSNRLRFS